MAKRKSTINIDPAINRLATLSDGRGLENQKPLRRLLEQVKKLHRGLSRKQKGRPVAC